MGTRHFITVDWCAEGRRGIFCDKNGRGYSKKTPYTNIEMNKILGPFFLILAPKSMEFSQNDLEKYTYWNALEEYNCLFGVARKDEDV